eukprot:8213693-Lingulodinium_polyedra.AAC.1
MATPGALLRSKVEVAVAGQRYVVPAVQHMLCLGVVLPKDGGTEEAIEARLAAGNKAFHANLKKLQNKAGGLRLRLEAFYRSVGGTVLFGAEGWILNQGVARRIRVWTWQRLRIMFSLKRRPMEGQQSYNIRTSGWIVALHVKQE